MPGSAWLLGIRLPRTLLNFSFQTDPLPEFAMTAAQDAVEVLVSLGAYD
jgi:hypothetical protein